MGYVSPLLGRAPSSRQFVNLRRRKQLIAQKGRIAGYSENWSRILQGVSTMTQQSNEIERKPKSEKSIFLINEAEVRMEKLDKKGAEKVQVQYLIDDRQGSNRFALRLYTVQKGGHTPLDQHPYEHQVYVLKGEGLLRQSTQPGGNIKTVRAGDSIFIPSNAIHQFSNIRDVPLVFLCVKGNPKLYSHEVPPASSDDSEQNYC